MGAAVLSIGILLSCLGSGRSASAALTPTCAAPSPGVEWLRVSSTNERPSLDRWCAGVGPPARVEARLAPDALTAPFAVVSWNTHVGAGNLDALIADLRAGKLTNNRPVKDFVLLVQEAYRAGDAVPSLDAVEWASAVLGAGPRHARVEVVRAAERLALSSIYVPSMRNGRPGTTAEDRGNAILTNAPLSDVTRHRAAARAPAAGRARGDRDVKAGDGPATAVRVVSTHFTNMVMHHVWVLSESGRLRQARALAQALPADGPHDLGGDLNSWFGYRDAAYRELVARLPSPPPVRRSPRDVRADATRSSPRSACPRDGARQLRRADGTVRIRPLSARRADRPPGMIHSELHVTDCGRSSPRSRWRISSRRSSRPRRSSIRTRGSTPRSRRRWCSAAIT